MQSGSRAFEPSRAAAVFGIDLRSLALFRICLAVAMLGDLASRSRYLVPVYGDAGVLPSELARTLYGDGVFGSVYWWASGSEAALWGVAAAHAAACLALLLGFRTRLIAPLCWLFLVGIQIRHPHVCFGGDRFLRMLLFWGLFLPLGARWSLDARRASSTEPQATRVSSIPSAALIVQIALMYIVTGLDKNGPLWWNGSAVHYALQIDLVATSLGVRVREWELLLPLATYATKILEVFGPLLLFVPWRTPVFRSVAIVLFLGFHLTLGALLDIGPFPVFCLVGWTALLPSEVWDRWLPTFLGRRAPESVPGPTATLGAHWIAQIAVAGLLAFVVTSAALEAASNLTGRSLRLPAAAYALGKVLRINQDWRMFSPNPPQSENWLQSDVTLADGTSVDPLRREGARAGGLRSASYPHFRLRIYGRYLAKRFSKPERQVLQANLARYLCDSSSAAGTSEKAAVRVRLEAWNERSPAPGGARLAATHQIVHERECAN